MLAASKRIIGEGESPSMFERPVPEIRTMPEPPGLSIFAPYKAFLSISTPVKIMTDLLRQVTEAADVMPIVAAEGQDGADRAAAPVQTVSEYRV
jgi:hypothetical protein